LCAYRAPIESGGALLAKPPFRAAAAEDDADDAEDEEGGTAPPRPVVPPGSWWYCSFRSMACVSCRRVGKGWTEAADDLEDDVVVVVAADANCCRAASNKGEETFAEAAGMRFAPGEERRSFRCWASSSCFNFIFRWLASSAAWVAAFLSLRTTLFRGSFSLLPSPDEGDDGRFFVLLRSDEDVAMYRRVDETAPWKHGGILLLLILLPPKLIIIMPLILSCSDGGRGNAVVLVDIAW
jgi:hypothetical protein